jgi:hypothetical protein
MQRVLRQLLTAMLLLAALPLAAQTAEDGQLLEDGQYLEDVQTLVIPLSSAATATGMATVVTSKGRPADCIAPVAVTRIDGEPRTVSAKGFFIEPGIHTINGRAALDLTNCPLSDSKLTIGPVADLEIDFLPGGTYYIGYYHQPANSLDWKLVVWHMEQSPSTMLIQ